MEGLTSLNKDLSLKTRKVSGKHPIDFRVPRNSIAHRQYYPGITHTKTPEERREKRQPVRKPHQAIFPERNIPPEFLVPTLPNAISTGNTIQLTGTKSPGNTPFGNHYTGQLT